MNFIKNVYFWLKLNLIVKPTKFIDERTNPKFGYDAYKFCKTWSKVFAFVLFPVFFIVFVSTAAGAVYNQVIENGQLVDSNTFVGFELSHSNPMFYAAMWSIVSIMITTAVLWLGQFWFAKFKPVVVEETAVVAASHHAGVHPKVTHTATATTVKYETKTAKKTKTTSKKSSKKTSKTK